MTEDGDGLRDRLPARARRRSARSPRTCSRTRWSAGALSRAFSAREKAVARAGGRDGRAQPAVGGRPRPPDAPAAVGRPAARGHRGGARPPGRAASTASSQRLEARSASGTRARAGRPLSPPSRASCRSSRARSARSRSRSTPGPAPQPREQGNASTSPSAPLEARAPARARRSRDGSHGPVRRARSRPRSRSSTQRCARHGEEVS